VPFGFEDGFDAVSVFELDLAGAAVQKSGGSFAMELVAVLAARDACSWLLQPRVE
jgi:hypothetical protein